MLANRLLDIEYFHRPIMLDENAGKPLANMTVVFSTYTSNERIFLQALSQFLGATHSSEYARKENPLLICPTADGNKYNGAIKWSLPVVTAEWLLECYRQHRKCDMRQFLVGASELPSGNNETIENICPAPTNKSYSTDHLTTDELDQTTNQSADQSVAVAVVADINNGLSGAAPVEQFTPVLKHRRLTEIGGGTSRRDSSPFLSQSPQTPYDHNRTSELRAHAKCSFLLLLICVCVL